MEAELAEDVVTAVRKPPSLLPIARHRQNLLYLIESCPVTIVVAATGSGKTTQIPQFLDDAGWCNGGKMIAVTQPRRVAATTVAARVASERGCTLGDEVGYSIRFEDLTSPTTRIKYMTDGMLLREALVDPLLSRYSVVMVDEAHERSISTDILLGLLKKILKRRPELRVVVSSATIQAEQFQRFFQGDISFTDGKEPSNEATSEASRCKVIGLDGRMYPVDILYLEEPAENYVERAVRTVFDIHQSESEGDILLFLTGREEIETAVEQINEEAAKLSKTSDGILALPLYAGLTVEQQLDVFEPAPTHMRKVVVSTNIAEASVTIDGVAFVIDCGFVKLRAYNPTTGIATLTATPTSQASAAQRAGRAGRTRPGKCFRLYTEASFESLPATTPPEIQRSDLAPVMLQLKALGIDNVARFAYLTPPPSDLVRRGLELLFSLGALDDDARLTKPLGVRMAELAIEPMMAKALLDAPAFKCLGEMLTIAAMTALQGAVWYSSGKEAESARRKFAAEEGDHLTLLNVFVAFTGKGRRDARWCKDNSLNYKAMTRAASIRAQLRRNLERYGLVVDDGGGGGRHADKVAIGERIRRCLTAAFFAHAARMQPDGTFRTPDGKSVLHAHPSSLMFNRKADWVVFHEVTETASKTYIRDITKIEKSWLLEYGSQYYQAV